MPLVEELEITKAETLGFFELGDRELALTYAPGKWSVRFILHHLADAESVMFERIRRVVSGDAGVLWGFDPDAWAEGLSYSSRPLPITRDVYESCRNGILHDADLYYETHGHMEWVHSETGLRTLKDEFDKVAAHNAHHLGQIAKALGPA